MDLEEFRKNAHLIVDWMADYLKSIENYPVRAQTKPGEVANQIPKEPPIHSEPMEKIFSDFINFISKVLVSFIFFNTKFFLFI